MVDVPRRLLAAASDHFGVTPGGGRWVSDWVYRHALTAEARAGLVLKEVEYTRGGKQFKRKQWVRAEAGGATGGDEPAPAARATPSLSRPPDLPDASVELASPAARQAVATTFGSDILSGVELTRPGVLLAAGNATNGAKTTVGQIPADPGEGPTVVLRTEGRGYHATRCIRRTADGTLVCSNNSFEVAKDKDGEPVNPDLPRGADMLANQVRALSALGVRRIETFAAGDRKTAAKGGYVGYKVWPKLGYDGELTHRQVAALPPELRTHMGDSRSILKLYESGAGRDWWAEHGRGTDMTFDLAPGSASVRTLEAYLASREKKG